MITGNLSHQELTTGAELMDELQFAVVEEDHGDGFWTPLNDDLRRLGFWLPITFVVDQPIQGKGSFSFTHSKLTQQTATTTSWFGGKSTAHATFSTTQTILIDGHTIHQEPFGNKHIIIIWANKVDYKHS